LFFVSYAGDGFECVCCGSSSSHMPLCLACRSKLFQKSNLIFENRCRVCGKELLSGKEICLECREKRLLSCTERVFPLFSYRLWNKEMLFKWKIEGERTLSVFFASLLNNAVKKIKENCGCKNCLIVPVPPRPGKIKENGWDQIDELCILLAFSYGYKILPLLLRNSSEQQKKRDRQQRLEKIQSEYSLNPYVDFGHFDNDFFCEPVIILDDIITTGATIEKCASLLKSKGFRKVFALTLFTAD